MQARNDGYILKGLHTQQKLLGNAIAHSVPAPNFSDLRPEVFFSFQSKYLVQQAQSYSLVNHVRPQKDSIELSSLSQELKKLMSRSTQAASEQLQCLRLMQESPMVILRSGELTAVVEMHFLTPTLPSIDASSGGTRS